jgi:hypothetical protein
MFVNTPLCHGQQLRREQRQKLPVLNARMACQWQLCVRSERNRQVFDTASKRAHQPEYRIYLACAISRV